MKIKETATVISGECLCNGVYSLWLETNVARYASSGQFVSVYSGSDARLLPRPISICDIDRSAGHGRIRLVFKVVGAGTREFSRLKEGDTVEIFGPLGNGFAGAVKEDIRTGMRALLIGGGVGIPPMLALAKELGCDITIVAGYRSSNDIFLDDELAKEGELWISTDDGSAGTKGTVIDVIRTGGLTADIIFACGPAPMLKGVRLLAEEWHIPAYISMEERMACGIGACLGCVCASSSVDDHSKVRNKRVCADGPVFPASEVLP